MLPNSDGRVLVSAVACCFCHVGSGSFLTGQILAGGH